MQINFVLTKKSAYVKKIYINKTRIDVNSGAIYIELYAKCTFVHKESTCKCVSFQFSE